MQYVIILILYPIYSYYECVAVFARSLTLQSCDAKLISDLIEKSSVFHIQLASRLEANKFGKVKTKIKITKIIKE